MGAVKTLFRGGLDALTADQGRVDGLDGLRALAVTAVLLCHTRVLPAGYVGVDVFFALSGYLITGVLLCEQARTGRIELARFYWRRTVRLAPALLVVIAVGTLYALGRRHADAVSLQALPVVLLYSGNWYQAIHGVDALGLWGHTWSLAVEEQFYVVWPLLLIGLSRFGPKAVGGFALALVIAIPIWRDALIAAGAGAARLRGTDVCADLLMIGCLLAVIAHAGRLPRRLVRWLLAPAIGVAVTAALLPPNTLLAASDLDPVVAIASAVIVAHLGAGPGRLNAVLSWRPLVALGRLSYGVYLWHLPLTLALNGHIHDRAILTAVVFTLAVLAAFASWSLVEQPAQRFRDRRPRLRQAVTLNV